MEFTENHERIKKECSNNLIKEIDILIEHLNKHMKASEKKYKYNQALDYRSKIDVLKLLKNKVKGVKDE